MTWKDYVSVASHNKPNIFCNFDSDLKQFIIKYEHLYKDNYTLQKTKSYNKNCWSLIYNMNYGLKSRLHKSQIYKKKKSVLG